MSIKTDNTQTLVNALAEIDRLKAAIKELLDEDPVFILRQQADALEAEAMEWPEDKYRECSHVRLSILESAKELRDKADELENNNAQEH